jgi:phage-related protein/DNA-binding XRE family transcriptional regulator
MAGAGHRDGALSGSDQNRDQAPKIEIPEKPPVCPLAWYDYTKIRMMDGGRGWTLELYVDERGKSPVEAFLDSLDTKTRARFRWSMEQSRVRNVQAREPLVRHLEGDLWESREESRTNIYRVVYFFFSGRRIVLLHGFQKKSQRTPRGELETARQPRGVPRARGGQTMSQTKDQLTEGAKRYEEYWASQLADPEFRRTYEDEAQKKDLWLALVEARQSAHLTQSEVALRLGVSQAQVARIEKRGYDSYTLNTLRRYVAALGGGFSVEVRISRPDYVASGARAEPVPGN